jgi:hypothetical protein
LLGCATSPSRLPAVPSELTAKAEIPGMPGVRYVAGGDMTELTRVGLDALRREQDYLAKQGHKGPLPPAVYVAISGGGDNGAYTAGLMNGWTAAGTRPEFKLVTGISTGALIAPFAFLGPKYDATLKEVYTTISPKDVIEPRSLLAGFLSDAMADNAPLWTLTRKSVTADLLKEIAAEAGVTRERRLYVIRNARLDPDWADVERKTMSIAGARGRLVDPHPGHRRPLPHLCHNPAGRRRFQPDVHSVHLQRPSQGGVRQRVHAQALRHGL